MNSIRILESRFNPSSFRWVRKIHLVDHQPTGLDGRLSDILGRRLDHPKDEVRAGRLLAGTPHPLALDRVGGVANTRGVEHRYRIAAQIKMNFQHVAGGSGKRRYDCRLPSRQPIKQRRLAGIRRTCDRDPQSLAQSLPLPRHGLADLVGQWPNQLQRTSRQTRRNIILIGEIDPGFDQSQRFDQPLPPRLGALPKQALELQQSLPALRFGLGRHQVRKPFNRGQIHAAVLKGTAGELSRLRMAQAIKPPQRGKQRGDHGAAAVNLQLDDVLAGLAVWTGKPQRQALVDQIAGGRIAHARQ